MFPRALIIVALLLIAAPATAGQRCAKSASMAEARALAERAAAHLSQVGPEKAFGSFVDPAGPYLRDDLYVFVFRRDGLMLLNVGFPELIGSNVLGGSDTGGGWAQAREALEITKNGGGGWIEYNWYNPCTGRVSPKRSYVVGHGDLVIGVGAYGDLLAV